MNADRSGQDVERSGPAAAGSIASGQRPPSRRRRDRHGRGLRGQLARVPVPLAASRSDAFDAVVLHSVEALQQRAGDRAELVAALQSVEFAVEDVPDVPAGGGELTDEILDDNSVPLSRVYTDGLAGITGPVIVLYRRPLESRAHGLDELASLVHEVVVEQLARLLNISAEDIDPSGGF